MNGELIYLKLFKSKGINEMEILSHTYPQRVEKTSNQTNLQSSYKCIFEEIPLANTPEIWTSEPDSFPELKLM